MTTPLTTADFEALFGVNAAYVEKQYQDWLAAPDSVTAEWRQFFGEELANGRHAGAVAAPGAAAVATPPPPRTAAPRRTEAPDAGADGAKPTGPESSEPEPEPEAESQAETQTRTDSETDSETEPAKTRPAPEPPPATASPEPEPLTGIGARIARNMAESVTIPTATSARVIPVKVLDENRRIVNEHLAAQYRGKASYTHMIAWALVQAVKHVPAMAISYVEVEGRPHRRRAGPLNLGIAVDVSQPGGARSLLVPNIKGCEAMDFATFLARYDEQVQRARTGKLAPADFKDTTFTLTNPGTLGTVSSLPRLMAGQSFILATGAIDVPAEFQGASASTLTELGVSKVMTVTSTYDHRVIQGADSGELLGRMHELLIGEHEFYEGVFRDLLVPYRPMKFSRDRRAGPGSALRVTENTERGAHALQYIRAHRVRGYLLCNLDPLEYRLTSFPELEEAHYGLTIWDLDREFFSDGATARPIATLREIREVLRATYTRHVGVEYMHIADPEQKQWLRARMEGSRNEEPLPREAMLRVLDKLIEAEAFERFLHTRFVGHKRFSIEGAETLIPALDALLEKAAGAGVQRVILGMAHRGRLNVLVNVLGKPLTKVFSEFEGWIDPESPQGSGDVKYHLGAQGEYTPRTGGPVQLELASNPSHLEAVDPVVEGLARARQDLLPRDEDRHTVLPVLIHGDAAFAGQGVVYETLNLSQLRSYRTGGTIHLIVNNQIGYTTLPVDARSTPFCTDVAKAIQAPIFHVNGDDPLAAVRMVRLALDYRERFQRDVVVDIVCYRRHGHNEGDEPSYTQPLLYQAIETHPSVRALYQDLLLRAKVLQPAEVEAANVALQARLKASLDEVRSATPPPVPAERPAVAEGWDAEVPAAVPLAELQALTASLTAPPATFTLHPKIAPQLERKRKMIAGEQPIDFGLAEHLVFATLLVRGTAVRLAGQDSARGTFSQRHSVLLDHRTGAEYVPLNHLAPGQALYDPVDSPLSEAAAFGFEYGYAVGCPAALTMWEAQFGDFVNGAQVQIDQFLVAGEAKWGQTCGLVLLLPHGYDGQGPEHSSARLERFLHACAENNLRVVNPSTPAQYFHLLRRQALDPVKKPLVVMTPKSLLRAKAAGSSPKELAEGRWWPVLDDPAAGDGVRRVVLCSGKVYYDLLAARGERGDVALVRLEQLYPFPAAELEQVLGRHAGATERIWCQEEPANMGAWTHVRERLLFDGYAGRPPSASPASGSLQAHKAEQAALVERALGAAGGTAGGTAGAPKDVTGS